jgi:hypothetical protein
MRYQPTQLLSVLAITALLVLQTACNNPVDSSNTDSSSKDSTSPAVTAPAPLCYAFVSATDTVQLKLLIQTDQSVSGELHYQLGGKDSNHGSIQGTMKGDTILADYKFMSEGTESTRQMVFLKTDSIVTEGYGPMEEVNGKMQFTKGSSQDFSKGLKLVLTDCKK